VNHDSERPPAPGQAAIVLAGLAIGVIFLGIQLWLLSVSLNLFLAGQGDATIGLAAISAAIFLGGILILVLLRRRPRRLVGD
jgi:hypothetical protein